MGFETFQREAWHAAGGNPEANPDKTTILAAIRLLADTARLSETEIERLGAERAALQAQLIAERENTYAMRRRILRAMSIEADAHQSDAGDDSLLEDVMRALDAHIGPDSWHTVPNKVHPLPVGTLVLSIEGECDSHEVEDGIYEERHTGSMAVGEIVGVDTDGGTGWSYSVVFGNGTWVRIEEAELADPDAYLVANSPF